MTGTPAARVDNNDELRCGCGRLLIRKLKEGYELKCVRCKQTHVLPYRQVIIEYLTKEDKV